ncbi:hypothetical protein L1049_000901 [Liquidambar formosana]|uniref:MORF/ORRM1/DAG-like MORF domain-containing protein n=1 Tax=Liquidambar formosana TaxID=63359 RepID=A0AAP0N9L7_LIQFO
MATRFLSRSLLAKPSLSSLFSLSSPSLSLSTPRLPLSSSFSTFSLLRLRPLSAAAVSAIRHLPPATGVRGFATRQTSSSLNDPNPNWSNRPPKETILLDGCDFEHWLVVVDKPEGDPTRDEIIDSYIKILASVVGSEEEARKKIYSVSTRCYYAFGCLVPEELSYKIKELPRVRWVLPDSYLDVKNKDYGGEPFINGQAVPYDPKYHEEWIKNNARANERNRRNDRPRNADRSRNFERRRENMQNRDFQNRDMQPPNRSAPNMGGMPPHNMGGMPPNNMGGMPPNNMGGMPPNNMGGMQPNNMGGMPPNNMGGMPPNNMGGMQPNNMGGMPPNNMGGMQPNNMGGMPPNNMGGMPPNMGGMPPNMGGRMPPNNMGGMPPNNMGGMHPNRDSPNTEYQNSYAQNTGSMPGGNTYRS